MVHKRREKSCEIPEKRLSWVLVQRQTTQFLNELPELTLFIFLVFLKLLLKYESALSFDDI